MTCLVVDPSATMRRTLRNALRDRVENLAEAADGRRAIELADASLQLVVTEWDLAGSSGLELVRQLREKPETAQVPILMVSTRGLKSEILEAASAGVSAYLLKPFSLEDLNDKLTALLAAPGDTTARAA